MACLFEIETLSILAASALSVEQMNSGGKQSGIITDKREQKDKIQKDKNTKTQKYNTKVGQMNSGGKQSERMSHSDALQ